MAWNSQTRVNANDRVVEALMAAHVAAGGKIIIGSSIVCAAGDLDTFCGMPFRVVRETTEAEYWRENPKAPPLFRRIVRFYELERLD